MISPRRSAQSWWYSTLGLAAAADAADLELQRFRDVADIDRGALSLRRDLMPPGDIIRSLLPVLAARGRAGRSPSPPMSRLHSRASPATA
ncbi:MAG: hypothetical protein WKG32_07385 [Gemmatimonadaceae bacterium]